MKLTVISQPYKVKCPVCGHELLIIVTAGKFRGQERCQSCDSVIEWDFTDEAEKQMRGR